MRTYPQVYNQRDPQWASQELGTVPGATIGAEGCILTCFSMKAGYYGHTITPNALNDIFNQRGIYVSSDLLSDPAITNVFPDISIVGVSNYATVPADLKQLQQLAADETQTITLELDFDHDSNDGIQTHFVELVSYDGNTLAIADPWYGTVDDFTLHYGTDPATTILKASIYKGTPVTSPEPTVAVASSKFTELVDKSTKYDTFNAAGYTTIGDVLKKVGDLTNANTQLQQEVQQAKNDSAALADHIKKMADQDSAAIQSGLDAAHERDQLRIQYAVIAQSLGLPVTASTQDITDAITALKKPAVETAKQVTPVLDELFKNAAKKQTTFRDWVAYGWHKFLGF